MLEELWGGGMALGGPRARPASRRLSRVAAGVGGKVSCWRRLRHLVGGSRRHPPHRACFCCVCLLCGCVCNCVAVCVLILPISVKRGMWHQQQFEAG